METFLFYVALLTLFFFIAFGFVLARGNRSIKFLKDVLVSERSSSPKVTMIIPARNEERNIQAALQSILHQNYGNLEIIVVDDRSTDRTAEILDRMTHSYPNFRVFHIAELPKGWLGKNYALYAGAQYATGDYLLFTDADVVMNPSTVRKAINYMLENQLDHIAVGPEVKMPGIFLNMFALAFTIFFSMYAQPWKAKNFRSSKYVGMGAFNLVRTDVYRAIGTYQAIAMRPDDDIKLGKLIKKGGYKQEFLHGGKMIVVEWYSSLKELIEGLMKNSFPGLDYNVSWTISAALFQLSIFIWPFFAILFTTGVTQIINLSTILTIMLINWDNAHFHKAKQWYIIGFPLAVLLFVYILLKSMVITLYKDGITWRDTHYSLAELRGNKV